MEDYKAWVPAEYLAQYYTTGDIAEDERGILRFIVDFLKETKPEITEMIEVGCGPTIHHAIPFVPYVSRLYMADYLERNLDEISKVVDGSAQAHSWNTYLSGILEIEGKKSTSAVEKRLQAFRSKVTGLLPCNVFDPAPLGHQRTFPLVTSFYTLECVSPSKTGWSQAMSSIASLVAPGGWLILSAIRNADKYLVCGKEFPVTNINEDDMRRSLTGNGFIPETVTIEVCPCEWAEEGFDTVMVCRAQKGS